MFFSNAFGHRFLDDFFHFLKVRTLIFVRTASVSEHFHKIDVFRKSSEKRSILASFWEGKIAKNSEKAVLKNICFFDFVFLRIFAIFSNFDSILGGPGESKNQ